MSEWIIPMQVHRSLLVSKAMHKFHYLFSRAHVCEWTVLPLSVMMEKNNEMLMPIFGKG